MGAVCSIVPTSRLSTQQPVPGCCSNYMQPEDGGLSGTTRIVLNDRYCVIKSITDHNTVYGLVNRHLAYPVLR